jgi:hypothetical protein
MAEAERSQHSPGSWPSARRPAGEDPGAAGRPGQGSRGLDRFPTPRRMG